MTEPTERPEVGQCGICCALVPEGCLPHHEAWHRTLTNTDTKAE
jgi:hypothetical protein